MRLPLLGYDKGDIFKDPLAVLPRCFINTINKSYYAQLNVPERKQISKSTP